MHRPPGIDVYTHLESLQISHVWDFYGGMIDYELHFQLSFLLKRLGGGAENSKLLIEASSFQLPTPPRGHPGAHPESPHSNKRHFYHLGNYKGFRRPVPGTGGRGQYIYILLSHKGDDRIRLNPLSRR